jgi:hypothetical protein
MRKCLEIITLVRKLIMGFVEFIGYRMWINSCYHFFWPRTALKLDVQFVWNEYSWVIKTILLFKILNKK